jgi:hypothetical protein
MTRTRICTAVAAALTVLAAAPSAAQDRAVAVPDMAVLLQNERVRVQYHDVAPGETTPMHSHPAYVAYVFQDYTAEALLPDGRTIRCRATPARCSTTARPPTASTTPARPRSTT